MSVLIKGMKMPKKCLDCPFMISRDNDDCILQSDEANAKFDSWDDMKASCPLVEIPTPYGRLGDLDELYKVANMADDFGADTTDILKLIIDTPTVIEGSETK